MNYSDIKTDKHLMKMLYKKKKKKTKGKNQE